MKRFLARLSTVIGAAVLIALTLSVVVAVASWLFAPGVPDNTVLELDFDRPLVEYAPGDSVLDALEEHKPRLLTVVQALERGARDDRVKAVVARVGNSPMGLATIQELRDAVTAFRASGKPAIAWAETFGEGQPGNGAYYLASAFDEIYLQPSGDIGLTGLFLETPFVRGTLDKLDVTPRMDHRQEYKTFLNTFTEDSYTAAHREADQALINSMFTQIVDGIARGRGLAPEKVRSLADHGPYGSAAALEARLVDGLRYRDEVYAAVRERFDKPEFLYATRYAERAKRHRSGATTVALIHGLGAVHRGSSTTDPLSGATMGADTVARAFRDAVADDDVKAIVFRINSPGGSYVASDTIWRETVRARNAGKPVIVTMGDVAASGGYFVSMSADRIVAQPGSITGSIGVVSGKMLTREAWKKLGVTWDSVLTSAHADFWTGTTDYSTDEYRIFQGELDRIYKDFTSKVAEGRKLPLEKVERVARGRVWTGTDALARGLVDELGGYPRAFAAVREALSLGPDAPLRLREFPERKGLLQQLLGEEPDNSGSGALAQLLEHLRPVMELARTLGLYGPPPGPLGLPRVPPAP